MHPASALAASLALATSLPGQIVSRPLGMQATAAINMVWTTTTAAAGSYQLNGNRFGGRIAVAMNPQWVVGVSVGSWQSAPHLNGTSKLVESDTLSTAVLVSSYAQFYPRHQQRLFMRAGVGYAMNRTYFEPGGVLGQPVLLITRNSAGHLSVTAGVGADFPIRPNLSMTLSADHTSLVGQGRDGEFTSGLQIGLGLTVR